MSGGGVVELLDVYATCHTAGCGNEGQPIQATVPATPATVSIVCGVCSNPITETADTRPKPDTEVPSWLLT